MKKITAIALAFLVGSIGSANTSAGTPLGTLCFSLDNFSDVWSLDLELIATTVTFNGKNHTFNGAMIILGYRQTSKVRMLHMY